MVTRGYSAEGEFVPGAPAQRLHYGSDQLGSVRRVFASAVSAPAYGFDTYGQPLQGTAPLTDFGFAGMLYNPDSGLYLTNFRAYDPIVGRWLSRDPVEESGDPAANLYAYVGGNPVSRIDPRGDIWPLIAIVAGAAAGILTSSPANAPGPGDAIEHGDPLAPYRNAAMCTMVVGATVLSAAGREIVITKKHRIAPGGNRSGHPIGRYPHYHRPGRIDPKTGQTMPGQSYRRHRPWETRKEDTSFWDRF